MSTTATERPGGRSLDVSQTARVPFVRLVKVEWRKMLDTRGGLWLLIITGLLLLLTVGITLLVAVREDLTMSSSDWSTILTIPISLLLPVFPIFVVTSEWSQRTGLVTFALEPHRMRVLLAKVCTVALLALAAMLVAIVLGAVANGVSGVMTGNAAVWNLEVGTLTFLVVTQFLYFLMAFGFATLLLNTPAAIGMFYVVALLLPLMVYSALYAFFGWARDLIPWIDIQYASGPFLDPSTDVEGLDFARVAVASTIWIIIPLVIGARRVLSSEPK